MGYAETVQGMVVVRVDRDDLPGLAEPFSWASTVISYVAVHNTNTGTWREYHVMDGCPGVMGGETTPFIAS